MSVRRLDGKVMAERAGRDRNPGFPTSSRRKNKAMWRSRKRRERKVRT